MKNLERKVRRMVSNLGDTFIDMGYALKDLAWGIKEAHGGCCGVGPIVKFERIKVDLNVGDLSGSGGSGGLGTISSVSSSGGGGVSLEGCYVYPDGKTGQTVTSRMQCKSPNVSNPPRGDDGVTGD